MGFLSRLFRSKERSPAGGSKAGASIRASAPQKVHLPRGVEPPTGTEGLVLYKYDSCPFCQRVLRLIEPLGLTQDIELRDTLQDPRARKLLQERTGRTQVPCLFIDGTPLFESSDIADYLQAYSQAKA